MPPPPSGRAPRTSRPDSARASSSRGNVAALDGYQFVFGKGGVPLFSDGQLLGAVGVSGAVPAENDHVIAVAASGNTVIPASH